MLDYRTVWCGVGPYCVTLLSPIQVCIRVSVCVGLRKVES